MKRIVSRRCSIPLTPLRSVWQWIGGIPSGLAARSTCSALAEQKSCLPTPTPLLSSPQCSAQSPRVMWLVLCHAIGCRCLCSTQSTKSLVGQQTDWTVVKLIIEKVGGLILCRQDKSGKESEKEVLAPSSLSTVVVPQSWLPYVGCLVNRRWLKLSYKLCLSLIKFLLSFFDT